MLSEQIEKHYAALLQEAKEKECFSLINLLDNIDIVGKVKQLEIEKEQLKEIALKILDKWLGVKHAYIGKHYYIIEKEKEMIKKCNKEFVELKNEINNI